MSGSLPHGFFSDDYDRVISRIDRLDDAMTAKFDLMQERLDEMDEHIRGNGQPGLKQRVAQIEANHRTATAALWIAMVGVGKVAWDVIKGHLGLH
jgi:hypothetical protein